MIKNIILDMGNVLLDYNPDVCLNLFLDKEEDRQLIKKELFGGPEWIQKDLGYMTAEECYASIRLRVPERIHKELKQCVEQWDVCMLPIPGAKEFCEYARKEGYRLYVLSNASDDFYQYFPRFAPLQYFDGIVVSSDIHMLKPDAQIYQYLLEQYDLSPKECFFIDDRAENVEGARRVGMHGTVFHGDFERVKDSLDESEQPLWRHYELDSEQEWKEVQARLQIAVWMGTIPSPDVSALEDRRIQKNETIKKELEDGKTVYGVRYYTPAMYLQYELTRFKLDFTVYQEEKLGPYPLRKITETEKRTFYDENRDLFTRYFGDSFGYEEVRMIIEKRLKEKEYEEIVQDILR